MLMANGHSCLAAALMLPLSVLGFWDLGDAGTARLREYLLRGGFLMVDDFHGPRDWDVFRNSMQRVFPDRPILEIDEADPLR